MSEEFWSLTPYQFGCLVIEWKRKQNLIHSGTAGISAILANFLSQNSKYSADDFLPFPPPPRYLTVDEVKAYIAAFNEIQKNG